MVPGFTPNKSNISNTTGYAEQKKFSRYFFPLSSDNNIDTGSNKKNANFFAFSNIFCLDSLIPPLMTK